MKKGKLFQMSKMLLIIMLPLFMVACSGDDDPVSIDSYLIGTWHTFKATAYGNGQNVDIEITKTGEYSASYSEVTFEKDGNAIMRGWVTDENGLSRWMEESYTYTVNGDIVTVKNSNETADFLFDGKNKTLLLKGTYTSNNMLLYINLYYKK